MAQAAADLFALGGHGIVKEFLQTEFEIIRIHAAPRPERSLVLFKPDCHERGLYHSLLTVFVEKYKLIELRWQLMDEALCRQHYQDHINKDFFPELVKAMIKAPVTAAVFEGKVADIRNLVETLRKTNEIVGPRNLLHASDSVESAKREIELWFPNLSRSIL